MPFALAYVHEHETFCAFAVHTHLALFLLILLTLLCCLVNMSIIMKPSLFNYPPCGWTVESVTFVGSQHSQVVENNIVVYESHMRTYTCTQNAVGFLLL